MNLWVLSPNHEILASASNQNSKASHFWSDTWTDKLVNFDSTGTLTIDSNSDSASFFVEGNLVVVPDLDNDLILYRIINVQDVLDSTGHSKVVTVENEYIYDLYATIVTDASFTDETGYNLFNYVLAGTGWRLNQCEYVGGITTAFSGNLTAQAAMQQVIRASDAQINVTDPDDSTTVFTCEPKFHVIIRNGRIVDYVCDVYKQRGTNQGFRFEYKHDVTGLTRTMDFTRVYTAAKLVGGTAEGADTPTTIVSVNNGLDYVYNDEANHKWNPQGTGYLMTVLTNDKITNPQALKDWGQAKLNLLCNPSATYTADVAWLEGVAGWNTKTLRLGDTVKIIDMDMKPYMTVSARVIQLDISYSDSSQNKVTFGDFKTLQVEKMPSQIAKLQQQLYVSLREDQLNAVNGITPLLSNKESDGIRGHLQFLIDYMRNDLPLMVNSDYLVKAQFHQEEGRGGYFHPNSGTTESQFLVIKGLLRVYGITRDTTYLNLAEKMANAAVKYLYPLPMPDQIDDNHVWVPNWLYNAADPFVSEKYYVDKVVTFSNGYASFSTSFEARKVFKAMSTDSHLLWDDPFASVVGTEYPVESYTANGKQITVQMTNHSFNGSAKVVYSDLGGTVIQRNQIYEAYPIWRPMNYQEANAAVDSLWWALDCYNMLAQYSSDPKWQKAYELSLQTIPYMTDITKMNDFIGRDVSTDDPWSAIGTYNYVEENRGVKFSRDSNGDFVADIKASSDTAQVQVGNGNLKFSPTSDEKVNCNIASSRDMYLDMHLSTSDDYDENYLYINKLHLSGDGKLHTYTINVSDFIKLSDAIWDNNFYSHDSNYSAYSDSSSTVQVTNNVKDYVRSIFTLGTADGAYAQMGCYPAWSKVIDRMFTITYQSSQSIQIRLTDKNGWYWYATIPAKGSPEALNLTESMFTTSAGWQRNTGTAPSSIGYPCNNEIVFNATKTGTDLLIYYIGVKNPITSSDVVKRFYFATSETPAVKITVDYIRNSSIVKYKYAPAVALFTLNTTRGVVLDWHGAPYSGYQSPYAWWLVNNTDAMETNIQFLSDAQDAYQSETGVNGFFAPLFLWDRPDDNPYGTPNTWSWVGPDPNTSWGGYQYRALETTARCYYITGDVNARTVCRRFMLGIDNIWTTGHIPNQFPSSGTPSDGGFPDINCGALFMRAVMYMCLKDKDDQFQPIYQELLVKVRDEINDCWNTDGSLKGTWSYDHATWYAYAGGEILATFAFYINNGFVTLDDCSY